MAVEIKAREADISRVRRQLSSVSGGFEKVMYLAINDTLKQGRNQTSRMIRESLKAKASEVKKAMTVKRASPRRLVGTIDITGKRIELTAFSPRQTKRGLSYMISKRDGRQLLPDGFMQKRTAWMRHPTSVKPRVRRGAHRPAWDIVRPKGPSIPAVYQDAQNRVAARVEPFMNMKLPERMDARTMLVLRKAMSR